jgi:hypothetical protein
MAARRGLKEALMTILMVNGGGNTPNGEAARGEPDLSKSYLPMESLLPADSPDTSSTATFLEFEFDSEGAVAGIVAAATTDSNRVNSDGADSIGLLGTSDALATSDFYLT